MAGRAWTEEELQFLRDNYITMTNQEMADRLVRECSAVQLKVNRIGLKGKNGRKPRRRDTYHGELPKVGDVFGKLTVKEVLYTPNLTTCLCACACNPDIFFNRSVHDLKGRVNHSCGCEKTSKSIKRLTTHGKSKCQLYKHWNCMKDRCNNPNNYEYRNYGGRGIKICEEWHNFENFYQWAIKHYAVGKTIDRLDNDAGYEPSNCIWSTPREQANNRRGSRKFTAFGESKNVVHWSYDSRCKVDRQVFLERVLDLGWGIEKAIIE